MGRLGLSGFGGEVMSRRRGGTADAYGLEPYVERRGSSNLSGGT